MKYGLFALLLMWLNCASADTAIVPVDVAMFTGKISPQAVDDFLAKYGDREDLTEFSVASQGGEVVSALRLARWIKSKKLNVRVRLVCFSACANYVFIAGNKKIINSRAFVAWHGDAEQKDFREFVAKYRELLARRDGGSDLSEEDTLFLEKNKKGFTGVTQAQKEQAEFYGSVGVDPMMGRYGQEPINYPSDAWTFTLKAMKLLGIDNVQADDDYGTAAYFKRAGPASSFMNRGPLQVFDSVDGINILPYRP